MKNSFLALLLVLALSHRSQVIINAYAKITSVTGSSVLAVSNVNQASHTFSVGERVIVMQMQDNVIGTNTNNNATFGTLSAIASAGNYEVRIILSRTPATGVPTSITLSVPLANTYATGTNSSLQLITFRNLGTNFTTTSDITGLAWDGNVGGVIALEVGNTLTLNHRISADGIGFRGGQSSNDADENCTNSSYRVNDADKGYKGEGIYKSTTNSHLNGRARIINGGGGGSENNAGGGGGGNYTAGGNGGYGYQCTATNGGYGLGGVTLSTSISGSRMFMGGGGGGGQENNGVGTRGGNGGGIILLKADVLATSSTCGNPVRISANGETVTNSGNDGAGGGGAGGSVFLKVNSFSVTAACPLTNSSSGSAGGNVGDGTSHGGGGGGGQGVVIYSITQPTTNITTSVTSGAAGTDNSGGTTTGSPGSGSNGSGVVTAGTSPLPIELLSFSAVKEGNKVRLTWSTASEKNNDYFTVEKSSDGIFFTGIGYVKGAGDSPSVKNYGYLDTEPADGVSYYRLKQTDFSKDYQYSPVISVNYEDERINFLIFPNPAEMNEPVFVSIDKSHGQRTILLTLYDLSGAELLNRKIEVNGEQKVSVNMDAPGQGVYILKIDTGASSSFRKFIIK